MLGKAKFLAKEAVLRVKYMTNKSCIFCKIVSGEVKSELIMENKKVIALSDINPVADVHILIVPKRHIESVLTVDRSVAIDIIEMFTVAQKIIKDKNLSAFRLAYNGGKYQHIGHLHWHLLSGNKIDWSKI